MPYSVTWGNIYDFLYKYRARALKWVHLLTSQIVNMISIHIYKNIRIAHIRYTVFFNNLGCYVKIVIFKVLARFYIKIFKFHTNSKKINFWSLQRICNRKIIYCIICTHKAQKKWILKIKVEKKVVIFFFAFFWHILFWSMRSVCTSMRAHPSAWKLFIWCQMSIKKI